MSADKPEAAPPGENFLARWARMKQRGQPAEAPSIVAHADAAPESEKANPSIGAPFQPKMPEEARPERTLPDSDAAPPLPSLESLTPQSDFSPFMGKGVDPQLRNLAMKKLFTDPHYNVMDRLDIYIDDYSTHAPLPLEVIKQMSISKSMRLFADEEEQEQVANGPDLADPHPAAAELLTSDAPSPQKPRDIEEAKLPTNFIGELNVESPHPKQ